MAKRTRQFVGNIQIRSSSDPDRADGFSAFDRRLAVRHKSPALVTCRAASAGLKRTLVRIENVSRTGVAIQLDRVLLPGTMAAFELVEPDGRRTAVLACARHAIESPAVGFLVGFSFSAELTFSALVGFGVPMTAPRPGDKRRWVRGSPSSERAVAQQMTGRQSGPHLVRVVDLSPAGIGLLSGVRLEPGTLLDLEILGRGEQPGIVILASVIYVTERDPESWLAGCVFIRELTDAELRPWM